MAVRAVAVAHTDRSAAAVVGHVERLSALGGVSPDFGTG